MAENEKLCDAINALRTAVEQLAKPSKSPELDPRKNFYHVFNQEADLYDRDFHKKSHDDLNTILIFAGLFSAVASAFIVDIQQELRPNFNEMNFSVLKMLLNATLGISRDHDAPEASDTKVSTVQVQSILFASLSSSLLAAFLAMLGKQWLNLHIEGSFIDRSRHRELRMRGMIEWRFKAIMDVPPLFMQFSLFLLGYALVQYLWNLNRTVATVTAAFIAFGALFYLFIVVAGTASKSCPFQTPVSIFFRYIIDSCNRGGTKWMEKLRGRLSQLFRRRRDDKSYDIAISTLEESGPGGKHHSPTFMALEPEEKEDETTFSSDVNCISTMFRVASGPRAIVAVTGFIPEINWCFHTRTIPLLPVFQNFRKSFEFLRDGRVLVRPEMREQAFYSGRALLHLRVQRSCVNYADDSDIVALQIGPILRHSSKTDHDLDSTLRVIDTVFREDKLIPWDRFSGISDAHYCWLSNILRLRAWGSRRSGLRLTEDVRGFVHNAFLKYPSIPSRVMADCLLIAEMIVGAPKKLDHKLLIKDKSPDIDNTVASIYKNLASALAIHSDPVSREGATEVLKLMMLVRDERICERNYEFFCTIMESVSSDPRLWDPARLALSGASKPEFGTVRVHDPRKPLEFLHHHFRLHKEGSTQDGPITDALCVLAFGTDDKAQKEVANSDFTNSASFRGLRYCLSEDASYIVNRASVFLLSFLDDQLFNAGKAFPEDEARALIKGWAHSAKVAVDTRVHEELKQMTLKTLMSLLDSSFWREFIPPERWDFLRHVGQLDDSKLPPSFYRCLRNAEVIPHLKKVVNQEAFLTWLIILWTKYPDVPTEVKARLEQETTEVAEGAHRGNIPVYLSILKDEMDRIGKKVKEHPSWSFDVEAVELRERQVSLQEGHKKLSWIHSRSKTRLVQ